MKSQVKPSKRAAPSATTAASASVITMASPVSEAESERRLRPVIDALYAHSTKQALKLIQQALTKRPGWPSARALRACVLLQMERFRDAAQEVTLLRADLAAGRVPINEDAAAKLLLYYQETRQEEVAAEVYEAAWCSSPNDVQLAETAYCLFIRGGAFASAQRLAFKLHRMLSGTSHRFAFWATAAIWLSVVYQARSVPITSPQPDTRMLKLGCAVMSKALQASQSVPSPEIVRFASRVFKEAGEFDAAIKLVSHPRLNMDGDEVLHLRAELSFRSTKDPTDFHTLLTQRVPNDWSNWLHYFECVNDSGDWIPSTKHMINNILTTTDDVKEPLRGPHLALLELYYRDSDWDALDQGITDYFREFGDRAVASRDLRPWLVLLETHQLHTTSLSQIHDLSEERGFPFHLHSCWIQLWCDNLSETPAQLVQHHTSRLLDDIEPTDRQEGDDYLILAAHKLLPYPESGDRLDDAVAVFKAIFMLEAGLTHSPCNHDFKLLLLRLYDAIGGIERMTELWDTLEVKHVQLSTLSHIVVQSFFESGHHDALDTILENIESLWREIDREIPECTSRAFTEGSLNAAVDFVLFKLRLERSVILAESMVIESTVKVTQTNGEPLGVGQALSALTMHPRFTVSAFMGEKRIISSDDTDCYRFWDYKQYDPETRLVALSAETRQEGDECSPERTRTIAKNLSSLLELLRLAEENGREGVTETEGASEAKDIPDDVWAIDGDSSEMGTLGFVQLRLDVAANLRAVKTTLAELATTVASGNANGTSGNVHDVQVDLLVVRGRKLTEILLEEAQKLVEGAGDDADVSMKFPRALRKCGKLVFEILMLVTVAVASFSPLISKGVRRMRKSGTKDAQSVGVFEQCRGVVLGYRDVLVSASELTQKWLSGCIDNGLRWGERVRQLEGMKELDMLVEDQVHPVRRGIKGETATDRVSRADFVKAMVDRVQSSHSVTCTTLLEALVAITRRLQLADL